MRQDLFFQRTTIYIIWTIIDASTRPFVDSCFDKNDKIRVYVNFFFDKNLMSTLQREYLNLSLNACNCRNFTSIFTICDYLKLFWSILTKFLHWLAAESVQIIQRTHNSYSFRWVWPRLTVKITIWHVNSKSKALKVSQIDFKINVVHSLH